MVDEEVGVMYDQLISYATAKQAYYSDPASPDVELSDLLAQDLTLLISTIQFQVKCGGNLGEAASIKSYRDFRSSSAEYGMRGMDRKSYWKDAAAEEADNIDKWKNNKVLVNLHMNGKDSGA